MTQIKNAMDLTYLRGQVISLYRLSLDIQKQIKKLEAEIEKGENAK